MLFNKEGRGSRVQNFIAKWYLLVIFIISVFYNFYYHPKDSWNTSIWADQEGYYVYLPGTFMYEGFKDIPVKSCCDSIADNKLLTKYTCGVAIMQSPFFLVIHGVVSAMDIESDGLTGPYTLVLIMAAIFYLTLGSYCLRMFLLRYFSAYISSLVVLLLFLGTNLFFYAVRHSGMSHVYSYFLFSSFLLVLTKTLESPSFKWFSILGIVFSLIVLTRPTNGILGLFLFFFEVGNWNQLKHRIQFYLHHWKYLIPTFILFVAVLLPQFYYWYYMHGQIIFRPYQHYKTGNEGFHNWKTPQIINVLFSHQNGWFIYTPLALFPFATSLWMAIKNKLNGKLILITLVVIIYVLSSWHQWWFGGSFGFRSLVEFYAILAIPFGYLLTYIFNSKNIKLKKWATFMCIFFVFVNIRMVEWYHAPWFGPDWTWNSYLHVWLRAFGVADIIPH